MKKLGIFGLVKLIWKYINKKVEIAEVVKILNEMDDNKDKEVTLGELITYIINQII